jgi:Type IV secretory system Conjugative DNA transfer
MFAGSRSGKGRSAILPNMLHYPGSVLATDPKMYYVENRTSKGEVLNLLRLLRGIRHNLCKLLFISRVRDRR